MTADPLQPTPRRRFNVTTELAAAFRRIPRMGPQSTAVADLLLRRLRRSTLEQYGSNLRPFLRFADAHNLNVRDIDDTALARFIAWVWTSERYDLHPGTLKSYVSATRTVLGPITQHRLDPHNALVTDLLQAYTNDYHATHPPAPAKRAWPAAATTRCASDVRAWLDGAGTLTEIEAVDAAHILFAALTYARGNTSIAVTFDHVDITPTTLRARLVQQKARRLRHDPPLRVLTADATPDHPVAVLIAFVRARRGCFQPGDRVFRTTGQAAPATLDDAVRRTARRLDLGSDLTGHCVRVGAISAAYRIGVPLPTVANFAGHARLSTTMGYIRYDTPPDAHAVALYGGDRPPR